MRLGTGERIEERPTGSNEIARNEAKRQVSRRPSPGEIPAQVCPFHASGAKRGKECTLIDSKGRRLSIEHPRGKYRLLSAPRKKRGGGDHADPSNFPLEGEGVQKGAIPWGANGPSVMPKGASRWRLRTESTNQKGFPKETPLVYNVPALMLQKKWGEAALDYTPRKTPKKGKKADPGAQSKLFPF